MKESKRVTKTRKGNTRKPPGKRIGTIRASADDKASDERLAEWYRPVKKPVTLRLDADVLAWFKTKGRGYQTRINRTLRDVMREEKNSEK
jgi:uncharacterized protein (DUF4415 family)